jgi:hypothetical protein
MRYDMIFVLTMKASKKTLQDELGLSRYVEFTAYSKQKLVQIKKDVPSVKGSIYASNYQFCICYIAWYKAFLKLGISIDNTGKLIWQMNEDLIRMVPKWLLKMSTRRFLQGTIKKARQHQKRSEENLVPEFDWKLRIMQTEADTFEVDIYECGMLKLGGKYDAMGMFPDVCRMDYLMAHYMGHGFIRIKTLADGDDCCNCQYKIGGSCEWAPEKRFVHRK